MCLPRVPPERAGVPAPPRKQPTTQVYQLILPELDTTSHEPLYLLVIMCIFAPFFAYAGNVLAREAPPSNSKMG